MLPQRIRSSRTASACGLGLLACVSVGRTAAAQDFQVVLTDSDADPSLIEDALGPEVGDQLRIGDQTEFLGQMAAATALSARGMGVDYASSLQRFVVGGSIGSALNGSGAGFGYGDGLLPGGGFAFQAAGMAGLNLGAFAGDDHPMRRFVLYGHGMAVAGDRDPFGARALNGGGHLQIQLLRVRELGPAGWGGLALTTGFEHTAYTLTLEQTIPIDVGVASWEADGIYEVTAVTNSVPIELSTNMRVAFLTVFGGGALDLMVGGAGDSEIDLSGGLTVDGGGEVGQALLTWSDSATVTGATARGFGGLQLNLAMVKLYGQLNVAFPEGFGGHAGLRVAM